MAAGASKAVFPESVYGSEGDGGGGGIEMLKSHFVGGKEKNALIVEYLLEGWGSVI